MRDWCDTINAVHGFSTGAGITEPEEER